MARKTLLTESEIRQFMKLANIKPLQEMGGELPVGKDDDKEELEEEDLPERKAPSPAPPGKDDDHDEKMEEAYGSMMPGKDDEKDEDLAEQDDEMKMDMDMDAPEGGGEMEMDAEMGEPAGMGMDDDAAMAANGGKEQKLADVIEMLGDLLDLDVTAEIGDDEMDMRGDVDADEGGDLEMADAAPEAPMGMDDDADEPMMESDEDIVQEVARRVAARLLREKKQEDVANKLAERIFRRLASK